MIPLAPGIEAAGRPLGMGVRGGTFLAWLLHALEAGDQLLRKIFFGL
jgi:hypothetical protein